MKIFVSDMTCGHCKMTIEKALESNGVTGVEIDLEEKIVSVELNGKTEDEVKNIIREKGYTVE